MAYTCNILSSYRIHHTLSINEKHSHSQKHTKIKQTSTMKHLTSSVIPTSVSSNFANSYNAPMHPHSNAQSPLLHITNRLTHNESNRKRTADCLMSKSNYYIPSSQSMSHTKGSMIVNISAETDANNYKSSITSGFVLQLRRSAINSYTVRCPYTTMQSYENVIIGTNNKLKIIETTNKNIVNNKIYNASMNPQNDNNKSFAIIDYERWYTVKVIHLNRNNSKNKSDMIIEHKPTNVHILLWRWVYPEKHVQNAENAISYAQQQFSLPIETALQHAAKVNSLSNASVQR